MSPGELGNEQSLLIARSCCSNTVVVDRTVLSDSVEDWTSRRQIWGTLGENSSPLSAFLLTLIRMFSSSTKSSMESRAESCGSLVLSGMHWSSVVSESVLKNRWARLIYLLDMKKLWRRRRNIIRSIR